MQSFEMPSFVCGINNDFFFVFFFLGGGDKNVRWNNVVTNSKQHEKAVTECQSELLFVPSNFPIKIRCL